MKKVILLIVLSLSTAFGFVNIKKVSHNFPIAGPKAEGKKGDILLCNDRVTFLVEARSPSSGYNFYPGGVLDAGFTTGKKCQGKKDYMGEVFVGLLPNSNLTRIRGANFHDFKISKEKKRVVLEVKGEDAAIPIVEEFLNTTTPSLNLDLKREYILEEGTSYLTVRTTLTNNGNKLVKLAPGYAFLLGDGLKVYAQGVGFDTSRLTTPKRFRPYIAAVSDEIAYAWFSPKSKFKVDISYSGVFFGFYRGKVLRPKKSVTLETRLYVLPPSVEAIREALGLSGEITLSGTVKDTQGRAIAGARVHLTQGKNHITMARTDAQGHYKVGVSAGEYTVTVFEFDHPVVQGKLTLTKDIQQDFVLESSARLEITVRNSQKQLIPAMLTAQRKAGNQPTVPLETEEPCCVSLAGSLSSPLKKLLGEERDMSLDLVQFLMPEKTTLAILPGSYILTLSRGFEYEIAQKEVALFSGKTLRWQATLKHSVNTKNYLSGDFHIHALPSPDSNDYLEDKVKGFAAHGLEVPVATDHNKVTDYSPTIKKLHLGKYMTSIIGDELTTIKYGHFNVFPLPYRPDKRDLGAPQWWGIPPTKIFQNVRKLIGKEGIIQVNHPRSTGGSGYFASVGLDPKSSDPQQKEIYSGDFDAVEIFNGKRVSQLKITFPDWYGFLNHGKKVTATGNSDSHHIFRIEAGYPRNFVDVGKDQPNKVKISDFVKAVKKQKVVVSGGPFIRFSLNGKGLGELASAKDKQAHLKIEVESPSWMPLTKITIVQNGQEIKQIPISSNQNVIKFDDKLDFSLKKDSWFIVIVEGEKSLAPVYPGARPFSFTNPIYVDVDGNGKFDPPGGKQKT